MTTITLAELGWSDFFRQQLPGTEIKDSVPARVMDVQKSGWQLQGAQLALSVRPVLADGGADVTVGDWLLVDAALSQGLQRLQRKSVFKRRAPGSDRREQLIAANVDTLFIVSSCNAEFNDARLERYLAVGREAGVAIVVVLTKADLSDDAPEYVRRAARLARGIHVEAVNALDAASVSALSPWLTAGHTIALLGSSGVGKSTLSNTLLGNSQLRTQAIREDDAKGRHTTTARSMYRLPGGSWLLDTPGMRELQLTDAGAGIADVFEEVSELARNCRFADCGHEEEPGCAVQQAVRSGAVDPERLARWRKLVREEAHNNESLAQRRARGRAQGRLYRRIQDDMRQRKNRD